MFDVYIYAEINTINLCVSLSPSTPSLAVSNHISTCLHNLFRWRMCTRYAATEINGTRSPRINCYNYRCGQMNCTCGSHAVFRRKVCTPAKLARFPSDLRRLSRWIPLFLSLFLFLSLSCIPLHLRIHHDFPVRNYRWLTKQLPIWPKCIGASSLTK